MSFEFVMNFMAEKMTAAGLNLVASGVEIAKINNLKMRKICNLIMKIKFYLWQQVCMFTPRTMRRMAMAAAM